MPQIDLKSLTVLVVAHSIFLPLAERLGRAYGKVYVWMPGHDTTFPEITEGMVGFGIPNVERVDSVFDKHLPDCDLVVFCDLYFPELQIELERQGKAVWGSRNGEELETYRDICKEVMKSVGLPSNPWKKIKGMDALREHLKSTPDQHIKINRFRGNFETFFAPNYETVKLKLDDIAVKMGPLQSLAEFIVEDDLPDCIELGIDTYCIDGQYPSHALVAIEVKDLGLCGQFMAWEDIPEPVRRWNEKMAPELAAYGYRGSISNELRFGKDLEPHMIDACCRMPSPPGELYQELYLNWPEIIRAGANGILLNPEPAGKWGCQVVLKSDWAAENPIRVDVPEKYKRYVKIFNLTVIEGISYCIPQGDSMKEFGAVIGFGDTLEAAVSMVKEVGESIQAHGLKFELGPVEKAKEQMEEINAMGLPVFDLEQSKEPA